MTHNYLHDLELLKTLLNRRVRYLGCLGPKRRAERLLLELAGGTAASAATYLGQFHAPAGLDIGAETPGEIALSIVAEIRAVLDRALWRTAAKPHGRDPQSRDEPALIPSAGS